MQSIRAKVAFASECALGEGSLWDDQRHRLLWVDIIGQKVMLFSPEDGTNRSFDVGQDVGTVVPTVGDKLLVALRDGLATLDLETGAVAHIIDPESDKPGNRFNDGKCDPQGRFWAGTMVEDRQKGNGSLYCFSTDQRIERHLTGIDTSNGLAWSGDSRVMYYIDTPTRKIRAYDFDPGPGRLSNERTVIEFDPSKGSPDGMTIDEAGQLWVAMWGGSKVLRVSPDTGQITFEVNVDANQVTSCAFGGDQLDELFITTARVGLSEARLGEQPNAGSLFSVRLPFRGVRAARYGGEV
jgi:sugar lactone lactonase YvrE